MEPRTETEVKTQECPLCHGSGEVPERRDNPERKARFDARVEKARAARAAERAGEKAGG